MIKSGYGCETIKQRLHIDVQGATVYCKETQPYITSKKCYADQKGFIFYKICTEYL